MGPRTGGDNILLKDQGHFTYVRGETENKSVDRGERLQTTQGPYRRRTNQ